MGRHLERRALAAGIGAAAMIAVGAAGGVPTASAATRNANFVGTWTPNTGVAWTITRENRRTGACAGYSALRNEGYGLVSCRVRGRSYRFVITYGGYRSVNTGHLDGNSLSGSFDDGSVQPYTARRTRR